MQTTVEAGAAPTGMILGAGDVRIWGMTARERLRRTFVRAGLGVADEPPTSGSVVLALGGWVYDESLIATLAKRPEAVLVTDDGGAVAAHVPAARAAEAAAALERGEEPVGLARLSLADLAYNEELRKREAPVLTRLTAQNVREVEARTFAGSYKGVTDLVTKYWWPVPARIVTRWCAVAGLKPNHVTFLGFLLVLAAFWLFWQGQFGWGLVCAWVMTFLDTVDGKLARVTLTSSAIGNVFDHGIDLIHPPFWWWAWYVGCFGTAIAADLPGIALGMILAGYVLQRVEEGIFLRAFGFHIHSWRPFDSFFRLITARRNPNLLILTPAWLLGWPGEGLILVGVWTAICLIVHAVQLVQAFAAPRERLVSWLSR
ncbi:CDP-alcohol phosphatidyltransferase family protein [Phenylobacterium sp. SCN 70-31]|uniref:CDP-alcohol phosphatidyltransferase family protein n=1 Tax=Phenylobacterium sp. SCN 70-31 TaxID=1660129 RepID=UPI000869C702|nr:MAG: phosphatidylglycerophosphate synthase [Phenylobacterium sp. SCN 70-31]